MPEIYVDWRFQAAACVLAKEIYYARIEAFGLEDARTWEVQSEDVKHDYVERAAELLRTLNPGATSEYYELALRLSREQAAKVAGRITPDTPWGEPS